MFAFGVGFVALLPVDAGSADVVVVICWNYGCAFLVAYALRDLVHHDLTFIAIASRHSEGGNRYAPADPSVLVFCCHPTGSAWGSVSRETLWGRWHIMMNGVCGCVRIPGAVGRLNSICAI